MYLISSQHLLINKGRRSPPVSPFRQTRAKAVAGRTGGRPNTGLRRLVEAAHSTRSGQTASQLDVLARAGCSKSIPFNPIRLNIPD